MAEYITLPMQVETNVFHYSEKQINEFQNMMLQVVLCQRMKSGKVKIYTVAEGSV